MDFEAAYSVQPGVRRTAELKGKISNPEVYHILPTLMMEEKLSPTFSSGQVSVIFNKIAFFYCLHQCRSYRWK